VLCIEDDFRTERICNTGRICNYDVKKGRTGRIGGATHGMVYEGHSKPRSLARLSGTNTPEGLVAMRVTFLYILST